jgi:hypothetical protein
MKNINKITEGQLPQLQVVNSNNETIVNIVKPTSVLENAELLYVAKFNFEKKIKLLELLTAEVRYKLIGDAWYDIKLTVKMFTHICKSMKEYGMDIPQLRHYGYPEGTEHHTQYQLKKMTAQERKDMPWKYTDKNPNSLYKQLAMCEYYYAHIDTSDLSISIPKEHLMELVSIASSYE